MPQPLTSREGFLSNFCGVAFAMQGGRGHLTLPHYSHRRSAHHPPILVAFQGNNTNVFVALDLAPPSAKRIRDLDVSHRERASKTRLLLGTRGKYSFRTKQTDSLLCILRIYKDVGSWRPRMFAVPALVGPDTDQSRWVFPMPVYDCYGLYVR